MLSCSGGTLTAHFICIGHRFFLSKCRRSSNWCASRSSGRPQYHNDPLDIRRMNLHESYAPFVVLCKFSGRVTPSSCRNVPVDSWTWAFNEWNAEISNTGHLPRNAQPERQLEEDKCEMATTFTAIMELFRNHRNGLQINPNLIQFWIGCEEHGNFPKNVQSSRVRKLKKNGNISGKINFFEMTNFHFFYCRIPFRYRLFLSRY